MFIKPINIPNRKRGKSYHYYRLCESYRVGGAPRHRTILNLGKLEALPDRSDHKLLADCIERIVYKKNTLGELTESLKIRRLAEKFAKEIIEKGLVDIPSSPDLFREEADPQFEGADYAEVDLNSIRDNYARDVGAEWLCAQTFERLGLAGHLRGLGWSERWVKIAQIYLVARAIFPASDHMSEIWLGQNSGLAEIYGMEGKRITRHHLYKVSRMLYRERDRIEPFLYRRTMELFNTGDKILLYDLTNTYFEGEKKLSKRARRGRSKEKRNDAKLLALGLVTDRSGFIKFSRIFDGNIRDSKTLEGVITELEMRDGADPSIRKVVVIDAGIATEENLKMLRDKGYDYECVSLSGMKEYLEDGIDLDLIELKDKRGNGLWVKWIEDSEREDRVLYVKSEKKRIKEASMEDLFCKRFEEGLLSIRRGIERRGGVKRLEKVHERIGRLKEKYPSAHRNYKVDVSSQDGLAIKIEWERVKSGDKSHGVYFIRTTLKGEDEKLIWDIYNTIREIEGVFRCLKSDLNMRPIFHQRDVYSESHIYGTLFAYTAVQSIRYQLKAGGINSDWRTIVTKMNSQKLSTTTMRTRCGKTIYVRKCSDPESPVQEIYRLLQYKDRPFWQKKSVLPKSGK